MPRIPVRTEPYTSPSRQHRHYKNKRDQVLRALGKAAYINGSHFAIMWVSARGDVETYASEALQGRLDDWFIKRGITDEAKELVRASRNSLTRAPPPAFDIDDENFDDDEDAASDDETRTLGRSLKMSQSADNTPLLQSDVFGENRPTLERSASTTTNMRARRMMAPLDTNGANDFYRGTQDPSSAGTPLSVPHSAMGMSFRSPFGFENEFLPVPHTAPLRNDLPLPSPYMRTPFSRTMSSSILGSAPQSAKLVETTFKNAAARTAFLELRFSQLQQGMCKTVAKAWIKVIEPKKQTRCPYNKGEEGKPDWWPEGVRHKEPDHLMKPERHELLLTILRSSKIKVARLQLATAEVVALIKADKVSLLMDVYRIAREEEKMREKGLETDKECSVQVSTLEGWSEADQCAIATEKGEGEEGTTSEQRADADESTENPRKRSGVQIGRSASTSAASRPKRQNVGASIETPPYLFGSGFKPAEQPSQIPTVPRRPHNTAQTWLLHEATRNGIKRTSVSSHTLSGNPSATIAAANANANSNVSFQNHTWQQQYQQQMQNQQRQFAAGNEEQNQQQLLQQNYGLVTPLSGNAQLMDPSFLTATKEGEPSEAVAGYMSAPTGHAQLYPHMPFNAMYNLHMPRSNGQESHQPQASGSQTQLQDQRQLPQSSQNTMEIMQMQAGQNMYGMDASTSASAGGALGLHGLNGMQWSNNADSYSNYTGAVQSTSNTQAGAGEWWQQSMQHPQHQQHQQQTPLSVQRQQQSADRTQVSRDDHGAGDATFDTSFASTIESAGPATPPQSSAHHSTNDKQANKTANDFTQRGVVSHPTHQSNQATMNAFEGWMYGKQG
ncbi:uncharacterized protein FA14DRAFT_10053 [Meira miltonrushii]|uniref:Subtelomeric hrmA-associated cluster protein AFUB-079030/YDR124W-like helical bundle domain-containing protein n=1 Tax=Meira miltonrushii TaxID=1280837 RepID=A0A316VLY0_9BASI|nr:uncharacterized protein FA14DRAFT_10053 [Meira miltonrushii]PWN37111.1 hypothetical protein FA14DRAFT_10053 [Meira miltonrushii]